MLHCKSSLGSYTFANSVCFTLSLVEILLVDRGNISWCGCWTATLCWVFWEQHVCGLDAATVEVVDSTGMAREIFVCMCDHTGVCVMIFLQVQYTGAATSCVGFRGRHLVLGDVIARARCSWWDVVVAASSVWCAIGCFDVPALTSWPG